ASPAFGATGTGLASQQVFSTAERLTGLPGTLASGNMPAECRTIDGADLGCADIAGRVIYMRPDLLSMLDRLNDVQPYQTALAVLVFCHEAAHVRFGPDEARAELWARWHAYRVARLLGATEPRARAILKWVPYWNRWISEAEGL